MELGGDAVAVYSMQVCKRGPRNKGVMTVFREMSITARDFVHGWKGYRLLGFDLAGIISFATLYP